LISHTRADRTLATCASALAGFVDAIAFIELGGFFVSFMSGNTTRLAVDLAAGTTTAAAAAAGLVAAFVAGVIIGSLTGRVFGSHRRSTVFMLVALLLALAAGLSGSGAMAAAAVAMALAMGAENAVFESGGEVRIGLTYMTGTLVKLGQRLTAAVLGGDPLGWLPYLLLWLGLAGGGFAGALTFAWIGTGGLWIAAGCAVALAFAAARLQRIGS